MEAVSTPGHCPGLPSVEHQVYGLGQRLSVQHCLSPLIFHSKFLGDNSIHYFQNYTHSFSLAKHLPTVALYSCPKIIWKLIFKTGKEEYILSNIALRALALVYATEKVLADLNNCININHQCHCNHFICVP